MVRHLLSACVLLLLTSCSTRERRDNEGVVCVLGQEPADFSQEPQTFVAGASVNVLYQVDGCLSSSCDTDREASCTAVLDGSVIQVDSQAEWTSAGGPVQSCTTNCGTLAASCQTPPLAEGTYTVRHGAQELTFTVPSQTEQAPCTGRMR